MNDFTPSTSFQNLHPRNPHPPPLRLKVSPPSVLIVTVLKKAMSAVVCFTLFFILAVTTTHQTSDLTITIRMRALNVFILSERRTK